MKGKWDRKALVKGRDQLIKYNMSRRLLVDWFSSHLCKKLHRLLFSYCLHCNIANRYEETEWSKSLYHSDTHLVIMAITVLNT